MTLLIPRSDPVSVSQWPDSNIKTGSATHMTSHGNLVPHATMKNIPMTVTVNTVNTYTDIYSKTRLSVAPRHRTVQEGLSMVRVTDDDVKT